VRLWRLCENCTGQSRLPPDIRSDEDVSRFLFQDSDYSKQAKIPKQRAFLPENYRDQWETSVGRLIQAPNARIAHLARTIRHPKQAIARAILPASAVTQAGLRIESAPQICYAEHAVLKGWPIGQDPKALHKVVAAVLAKASALELLESGDSDTQ
jgi:hypothetical protein